MKYHFSLVVALLFITNFSHASVTDAVSLGCGYSDFIFDQIPRWTKEKSQANLSFSGKQGETGRRFLIYPDKSWILTFEFFSSGNALYDVSCIVLTGLADGAYEATTSLIESLPSARLGPSLRPGEEPKIRQANSTYRSLSSVLYKSH